MGDTTFVDFKAIKQTVSITQVLSHYGLLESMKPKGKEKLVGRCPIHKGESATTFQVSTAKNAWYCFGCTAGGNVLDLVMQIEKIDVREAANRMATWFDIKDRKGRGEVPDLKTEPHQSRKSGYLRALEEELRALLDTGGTEAVVSFVKERVLESYRNGVREGKTPAKK